MKQTLQKLLIAIAGLLVSTNASAKIYKYSIIDDINYTCAIGASSNETYSGEIIIPAELAGYTVVEIMEDGFKNQHDITSFVPVK